MMKGILFVYTNFDIFRSIYKKSKASEIEHSNSVMRNPSGLLSLVVIKASSSVVPKQIVSTTSDGQFI